MYSVLSGMVGEILQLRAFVNFADAYEHTDAETIRLRTEQAGQLPADQAAAVILLVLPEGVVAITRYVQVAE